MLKPKQKPRNAFHSIILVINLHWLGIRNSLVTQFADDNDSIDATYHMFQPTSAGSYLNQSSLLHCADAISRLFTYKLAVNEKGVRYHSAVADASILALCHSMGHFTGTARPIIEI